MKAILLCAGYATRLYPLTINQPKPLLHVAGKAILEYILDALRQIRDLSDIYIVTNDKFHAHFERWNDGFSYSKNIKVINDGTKSNETRLGAIGDLEYVLKSEKIDDDLLVIAGDNIFTASLERFVDYARSKAPDVSIGVFDVKRKDLAGKYGLIERDETGKITGFWEKPNEPPTTLASAGIYYFPKENLKLFERFREETGRRDEPGYFIQWLVGQGKVRAHVFEGFWYDIGDKQSYKKANEIFKGRE